jgi:hypothetical protein
MTHNRLSSLTVAAFVLLMFLPQAFTEETFPNGDTLRTAFWIWSALPPDESTDRSQLRCFHREITLPKSKSIKAAKVWATADNRFSLFVNGIDVMSGENWKETYSQDVMAMLKPDKNLLSIEAFSSDITAGLLFCMEVLLEDGQQIVFVSDESWDSIGEPLDGWNQPATSSKMTWEPVKVLGPKGMRPWELRTAE